MAELEPSNEEKYIKWLSSKVSPSKVSDFYLAYSEIESHCLDKKIIHKPLLEITDIKIIRKVKDTVERNRVFRFFHRANKKKLVEAISFFYRYVKEESFMKESNRIEKEQKNDSPYVNTSKEDINVYGYDRKNPYTLELKNENDLMVDFNRMMDYSYTKPTEYVYFDTSQKDFNSWKGMYVSLVNTLLKDYDYKIVDLKNKSINNPNGRIDLADSLNKEELVSPKMLLNGMYIETNLSSIDIVKKIKSLLNLCLVDCQNVKIYYEKKKDSFDIEMNSKNMSGNVYTESRNGNGETFYKWMKASKGLAEATCRSYYSGINNIDDFSKENKVYDGNIYESLDYNHVNQRKNELLGNCEFLKLNESQHNRLTASLNNYLEFLSSNFDINNDYDFKKVDDETLKMYQTILSKNFPRNFRYNSGLNMKRFREFWKETWGEELKESDDAITENIKKVTIFYIEGDKSFALVPETILSEENKKILLDYIDRAFKSGKSAIYYNALYEETTSILYDSKINNADMLREYLKYIIGEKYYFRKAYFSTERDVEIDPVEEIKNYLISIRTPVMTSDICDKLSHIPRKKIEITLHANKEFIRNAKGIYFHSDIVDITDEELESISKIINIEIDKNGFMSENELLEVVKVKSPEVLERYPELTDLGVRNAIGYKLKDKYSFNSKIISGKNQNFSVSDIYEMFCNKHSKITLNELKELKKNLNSIIYFDVIYEKTLRISEDEFVSKEFADFNVSETDKAIDDFCHGDYIAIQDIEYFSSFPEFRFSWNSYLLEHYVADYSEKYKLVHINFNESSCVGGIVKVTSDIEDFYDLVVNVLADSNIILDADTALNYLYNRGFLGRRSYKDIEKALIQVSALREQKG